MNGCDVPRAHEIVCSLSASANERFKLSLLATPIHIGLKVWSRDPDIRVQGHAFTVLPYSGWGSHDFNSVDEWRIGPVYVIVVSPATKATFVSMGRSPGRGGAAIARQLLAQASS